jgi:hypothetical protein
MTPVAHILHRIVSRAPSPSVDLYFLNACGAFMKPDGPVRQVAPTVFESDAVRLVIRHDVGAPRRRPGARLVYLLDDAVFDGVRDRRLPALYRLKLALAECATARRTLPCASAVVASSQSVAASLPSGLLRRDAEIIRLDPYWEMAFPALDHFGADGEVTVAFIGAATHAASLPFLRAVVERAMATEPRLRLLISANHRRALRSGPSAAQTRFIEAAAWPDYRRMLPELRAHVALYPLDPSSHHARARSVNKLIEHALIGAAPLYAAGWPPGEAAARAGAGVVLPPGDVGAWAESLVALARDRRRAQRLSEGAQAFARRLNDPQRQRATWRRLLALD